jgi:uncharacterized membrane protein (DUF485 family)
VVSSLNARILEHPFYRRLCRKRRRCVLRLGGLTLCVYCGFLALIAFGRGLFSFPLAGGVATTGILMGLGFIAFSIWIVWRYERIARRFDRLTADIVQELKRCPH